MFLFAKELRSGDQLDVLTPVWTKEGGSLPAGAMVEVITAPTKRKGVAVCRVLLADAGPEDDPLTVEIRDSIGGACDPDEGHNPVSRFTLWKRGDHTRTGGPVPLAVGIDT